MQPVEKYVSLKTAKKLKEAGFPQETERWWFTTNGVDWSLGGAFSSRSDGNIAAPDAQEIGELLPIGITTYKGKSGWTVRRQKQNCCGYNQVISPNRLSFQTEAEARAAAWLWFKEEIDRE